MKPQFSAALAYMLKHRKQLATAVGFGMGLLDAIQRASG